MTDKDNAPLAPDQQDSFAPQTPEAQPAAPAPAAAQPGAHVPTTGLGIAGLVLGILAVPPAFIPFMNFLSIPLAIVGIILAAVGFSKVRKGTAQGKGIAVAGIVLNLVAIGIFVIMYGSAAAVTGGAAATANSAAQSAAQSASGETAAQVQEESVAEDGGDAAEQDASAEDAAAEEEQEEPAPDSDYSVSIKKAELSKDYKGKKAVVVTFKWKNNSDDARSFATALSPKVYQDGVELDMAIGATDGDNNYLKEVKPGHGTTVKLGYVLDGKEPVEVEVGELFDFSGTVLVSETFELK